MTRIELIDGLKAAAEREKEFHPKLSNGTLITAWERRKNSLMAHAEAIEKLEQKTAELEKFIQTLKSRPF
jgi:hypothetical protein